MRKPPNKYKYEVGQYVRMDCYPEAECGENFLPSVTETAKRFSAVKGFGNTGRFLITNRTTNQEGEIVDRTDGLYVVSYQMMGGKIDFLALCAEIEIKPIEPYSDAVVRWLDDKVESRV